MSEFEQDPSANTGRFRAFVERGEEDVPRVRRSSVSPAMLIGGVGGVVVIIATILIAAFDKSPEAPGVRTRIFKLRHADDFSCSGPF